MRLTEADTDAAAAWIVQVLDSMLRNIPDTDMSSLGSRYWEYRKEFGEGGRPERRKPLGKTPAFAEHYRRRFETVR